MLYYSGNELYKYIKKNNLKSFKFFSGNIWQLVYGNKASKPVLLVLAIGLANNEKPGLSSQEKIDAFNSIISLSERTKIPLILVQFTIDQDKIESVYISNDGKSFEKKTIVELTLLFQTFGLPTSNTYTQKATNDRTSSAYHNWQRKSLGKDITVSDIDLMKVDDNENITTIFELKRSRIPIDSWTPFPADYVNFKLLLKLCKLATIELKIAYNYLSPIPPRIEDISKIKVFKLKLQEDQINICEEGIYPLNVFLNMT